MFSLTTELWILALLVMANGFLAAAETAVVSARRAKLQTLARAGRKGSVQALSLTEHPAKFLALVQFWLTLSGILAGVLAGSGIAESVASEAGRMGWSGAWVHPTAFAVVLLLVTVFMLVFGELIPKRIALANPERTASLLSGSMNVLAWLAAPILGIISRTTEALVRLLRVKPRPVSETVGDDEVRALVEQGLHAGVFERAEKEMVEGVLSLDKLAVTAIMTPRPKIVFLNVDDPEESNWRKIVTSGHSYFPVYQTNRDQVIGLVSVKALWAHSAIGLPTTLKNLLVPALFAPEKMTASQLLEQFKKTGRHTAIVTDEFGVVQGMVTLIDVFEAIVGDLPESGQKGGSTVRKTDDGSWQIDATLPISDLKRLLGTDLVLPHEAEAQFQTVGGFIITHFGRIPNPGESFEWNGWKFEVSEMDRRRVDKVRVLNTRTAPSP